MHRPPAVPLTQQTLSPRDSVPSLENGHKIVMGTTLDGLTLGGALAVGAQYATLRTLRHNSLLRSRGSVSTHPSAWSVRVRLVSHTELSLRRFSHPR